MLQEVTTGEAGLEEPSTRGSVPQQTALLEVWASMLGSGRGTAESTLRKALALPLTSSVVSTEVEGGSGGGGDPEEPINKLPASILEVTCTPVCPHQAGYVPQCKAKPCNLGTILITVQYRCMLAVFQIPSAAAAVA